MPYGNFPIKHKVISVPIKKDIVSKIERSRCQGGWVNISTPGSSLFYNTGLFMRDAGTVVWECFLCVGEVI